MHAVMPLQPACQVHGSLDLPHELAVGVRAQTYGRLIRAVTAIPSRATFLSRRK